MTGLGRCLSKIPRFEARRLTSAFVGAPSAALSTKKRYQKTPTARADNNRYSAVKEIDKTTLKDPQNF